MPTNSAFVFIKPHAVTDKVKELTGNVLTKNNIKILEQGEIKSEVRLVDRISPFAEHSVRDLPGD